MPAALVFIALLALLATMALAAFTGVSTAARAHLAFATGIMPLILAAISYFVPVLTRSRDAPRAVRTVPWIALVSGGLAFAWFLRPGEIAHGLAWAAAIAGGTALGLALWIGRRGRAAIGSPHPCLHWYLAAVLCLALALAAVLAMPLWPEHSVALKRIHLHLNTGGFIGLTALGTLQVLMPTVAGRTDPGAAARLRGDLPFALAAVLAIAAGAAGAVGFAWLAVAGALLWTIPVWRTAKAWAGNHGAQILCWHGAAPALAAALGGFALSIIHGIAHAIDPAGAQQAVIVYVSLFLLPLVTGAATQLLPTWLRAGPQGSWHAGFRSTAGRWGGVRAILFLCGGVALSAGLAQGAALSALALIMFLVQIARGLAQR